MPDTPRTWTEIACPVCRTRTGHYDLRGPLNEALVGEREVLAEHGRMLDLLEKMREVVGAEDASAWIDLEPELDALLSEHGRLPKEEQPNG